jgi:hypothetical protein
LLFLINTTTPWEEAPRARHQVAREIASRHPVLFVAQCKQGKPGIRFEPAGGNLTVAQPTWYLPHSMVLRVPGLNEIYQRWLFASLKHGRLENETDIRVVNFDCTATLIFSYFENVVYFCNDEHLEWTRGKIASLPYLYLAEKRVIAKSKHVFVVSTYLQKKKSSGHTHLVLTGADASLRPGSIDPASLYRPLEGRRPVVQYTGFINASRINQQWIIALAARHPDWTLELCGPVDESIRAAFKPYRNLVLRGPLKGRELGESIAAADVCIIPYRSNRVNLPISLPNKFWQYLLFGKPVVTTRLPYMMQLPESLLYTCETEDEFISNVERAMRENSMEFVLERLRYIGENTWKHRVDQMFDIWRA